MVTVRIGGNLWAHSISRVEDVSWSETWERGCEQTSWAMRDTKDPRVRVGAPVEVFDGAGPVWAGRLAERGRDGQMTALGLWRQGEGVLAVDGAGELTFNPDTAVDAAIAAGRVSWKRSGSLGAAITPEDATQPMMLDELLDACVGTSGDVWRVDGRGIISRQVRATAPRWHVAPGWGALTPATDGFVTALRVRYLIGTDDPRVSQAAVNQRDVDRYGWIEGEVVDITAEGIMAGAAALVRAQTILAAFGPRVAFTETMELTPGELTTIGGTPAGASVRAGHMIRVAGVWDSTRPRSPMPHVDQIVGRVTHSGGVVNVAALDQPARTLADVLAEAR